MKNFILAYDRQNESVARRMDVNLSRVGFQFRHITDEQVDTQNGLIPSLVDQQEFVLLLVSDNFLKSKNCMYKGLASIQALSRQNRVLPIILDGQYYDSESQREVFIPTAFERLSEVIKYMNFWQEQYLELRKEKRNLQEDETAAFEDNLRVIRNVSTEIGEFLRFLRNNDYATLEQFQQNKYELFFQFSDNEQLFAKYQQLKEEEPDLVQSTAPVQSPAPAPNPVQKSKPVKKTPKPDLPEIDMEEEIELDAIVADPLDAPEPTVEESEPAPSKEETYRILESIFDDEEEDEEEEQPAAEPEETAFTEPETFDEEEEDFEIDLQLDTPTAGASEDDDTEPGISTGEIVDIKQLVLEAERLLGEGKVNEGLKIYQSILKDQPDQLGLRFAYAQALFKHAASPGQATDQLEEIIAFQRDYVPAYLLLAEISELKGDYLLSRNYYEKAASLDPDIPGIDFKLGMMLATHFPDQAVSAAEFLRKSYKKEDNPEAHYHYGVLQYERLNNYPKAVKHFQKVLKAKEDHPFVHYDLAILYHKIGQQDKAHEYYQRAYEINPELRTPENDAAFALAPEVVEEEEVEVAAPVIERIVRKKPSVLPDQPDVVAPPTVFITGATSGIGRATAEVFAKNGYRLLLTGRRSDRLESIQETFKEQGTACQILPFDVRDRKAVEEAIDGLADDWRQIDILINNAGLASGLAPIQEGDIDDWEAMIDTNVKGLLYMTRAITPYMVKRREGHIINICSTAGKEVYPQGNVYCATKFAVDALTKAMRLDLHSHNIRVSQVAPGHVEETEFAEVRFHGDQERAKIYEDFKPLSSGDVAEVIYFIATRPAHVNIQDVLMMGTQQASSNFIDRSGR